MAGENSRFGSGENPLLSESPELWSRLIEAVQPAAILVLIRERMSPLLRGTTAPEDIWQEALLHAWQDRKQCQWRGIASFRRWLLQVVVNRIRDAADRAGAAKRGPGAVVPLSALAEPGNVGSSSSSAPWEPSVTTTPSRLAIYREEADAMQAALEQLPGELRDVVRLRLFEERTMPEVAERLGIGLSAARHRFRRGAARFEEGLSRALASKSSSPSSGT